MFKEQDGNLVVQYVPRSDKETWKFKFFGSDLDTTLLRESSPLTRTGAQDKSCEGKLDLRDHSLNQRSLVKEQSIVDFLAEYVQGDSGFQQRLHQLIERSKSNIGADQAAANAMTILVRADVSFNGADLRGIMIPGADLSGGHFDSAQLQAADLTNTNLRNVWLRQAI
ncbi:hypothetical protein BGZ67_004199 [Mortierella alpina]|nr:hypothetical protein BGZ67_004199 [Mortierella alpina]